MGLAYNNFKCNFKELSLKDDISLPGDGVVRDRSIYSLPFPIAAIYQIVLPRPDINNSTALSPDIYLNAADQPRTHVHAVSPIRGLTPLLCVQKTFIINKIFNH